MKALLVVLGLLLVPACAHEQSPFGGSAPAASSSVAADEALFISQPGRIIGTATPTDVTSNIHVGANMSNMANDSTSGSSWGINQTIITNRPAVAMLTGAVSGNTVGRKNDVAAYWDGHPSISALIATPATISSMRVWVVIGRGTDALQQNDTATNLMVGFRYSTSAVDTTFKACGYGDAGGFSCLDTGVTVAASTIYKMVVDYSSGTNIKFYINGTLVATRSTGLPTGNVTPVGPFIAATTLTAATRSLHLSTVRLARDG